MPVTIPQTGRLISHPREDIPLTKSSGRSYRSTCSSWAVSFIYAGTSALLLLISSLYPPYWFLSCIALVPLLYRIRLAGTHESMRLGLLFGVAYSTVVLANGLIAAPVASVLHIIAFSAFFAAFGWSVGRLRVRYGFNPIVIAASWIVVELALLRLDLLPTPFAQSGIQSYTVIHGMAVLFGFLMVSFAIACLNAVIAVILEICLAEQGGRTADSSCDSLPIIPIHETSRSINGVYFLPEGRAPPAAPV